MSYSNGIISATDAVTMTDVKRALGVYNYSDIGGLILEGARLGKINKWSLHKPIRLANRLDKLSDADLAGTTADHGDGIYYGIKFNTVNEDIVDIHNTTFEYLHPRGGASEPFRLGDFQGYNANARADLYGNITPDNGVFFKDVSDGVVATIAYAPNSGYVPVTEIINQMTGGQRGGLELCYPCVLVGNWAKALISTESGNAEPMGSYTSKNYRMDFSDCPENLDVVQKVSFFLYPHSNNIGETFSLTSWNNCGKGTLHINHAFPIPDLTGLNITFGAAPLQGLAAFIGDVVVTGENIYVHYSTSSEDPNYDVRCVLSHGGRQVVRTAQNEASIFRTRFFYTKSDFPEAFFIPNTPYEFEVELTTSPRGANNWGHLTSRTVTLTFTI